MDKYFTGIQLENTKNIHTVGAYVKKKHLTFKFKIQPETPK